MTVSYLDLADYLAIAASVTGIDVETLSRAADSALADSALHPLSDGNKRAARKSLRVFV